MRSGSFHIGPEAGGRGLLGEANGKLERSEIAAYSVGELPMSMVATPVALFLPAFYTRELGLGLTEVGFVLMFARLWDVVTDPAIGWLSDRTPARFGRRRPWLIAAVPLMLVSVWMLFRPVEDVGTGYLLGWIMVMWLGWTLFNIPYFAWGAELSPDYNERTRITGLRTAAGIAGVLIAIAIPAASEWLTGYGGESGEALALIAVTLVVLMPLTTGVLVLRVRELPNPVTAVQPILEGLRIMWANRPFRILLVAFMASSMAISITTPLFVLFITYVVGAPDAAPRVVLAYYLMTLLGVPFWMWLADRTDKHVSWLVSVAIMGMAFPLFLLLGEGDLLLAALLLGLVGIGGGNTVVVPASMKADVIDLDTLESGEDRAGLFFAAWSTATKLVSALGVGIAMPVLDAFGFDARGNNGPDQIAALQYFFALAPLVFYAMAVWLVVGYPLTRGEHQRLAERLDTVRR